jgi:hypothetical protein
MAQKRASGRTQRQNSYRKSPDSAGQNPHQVDIQQPGKPGDFGNTPATPHNGVRRADRGAPVRR